MSIPTLAEKLKALKVTEAGAHERACADKVTRAVAPSTMPTMISCSISTISGVSELMST